MAKNEPDDLHAHAVDAESALEQLATGLAQAKVDPGVVQTVTKMADVTRKIVKVLGKGQAATGDAEGAEPGAPPEGGQPGADPAQAGPPAAPVDQAAPSARPTLDSAIDAHQADVAKRRATQPA